MASTIPVAVSSAPGMPPPGQLVGDVFAVTQDGLRVRELDNFAIVDGAGVYDGPQLPSRALRWAVRIRDSGSGGVALDRSGPPGRLPGRGPIPAFSTRISIFRTGGTLTLDEGDGLPQVLVEGLRARLGPRCASRERCSTSAIRGANVRPFADALGAGAITGGIVIPEEPLPPAG